MAGADVLPPTTRLVRYTNCFILNTEVALPVLEWSTIMYILTYLPWQSAKLSCPAVCVATCTVIDVPVVAPFNAVNIVCPGAGLNG